MENTPLRPAASLILMRDKRDGPPDILMVRRAANMAFAGGAWVFPGGRIESADLAHGLDIATDGHDPADMAARIAAIRETIEEVGIAIGIAPSLAPAVLALLRAGLARDDAFVPQLEAMGATIDYDELIPFARWIPMHDAPRRFDTRFYLARAPEEAVFSADGGESVEARWIGAGEVLERSKAREMPIIFPTYCNLIRLAEFRSFAEAADRAERVPVEPIEAFVEEREGIEYICIAAGLGYPAIAKRYRSFTPKPA